MAVFDNLNYTHSSGMKPGLLEQYFHRTLLRNMPDEYVHGRDAQVVALPQNNGKYVRFRRYTPFPAITTPLAEGKPNDGQMLTQKAFDVMVKPYAGHVEVTDELNKYVIDDTTRVASDLLNEQAILSLDTITRDALHSGLNVQYVDGANNTTRATLAPTDILTYAELKKAVRTLRRNKCKPFADGFYHAIVHPDVVYDLTSDPMWVDVSKYQDKTKVEKYELGTIYKIKFFESTNAKIFTGDTYLFGTTASLTAAAAVDVTNRTITVSATLTEDDARALAGKLVDVQYTASGTTTKTPMCIERVDAAKKTIKFRWMPAASVTTNWTTTNNLTIVPTGAGASSAPVYSTLIYGQDAFGRVELGGKGGFEMIYHEPGSAGANDPYNQRGTIAWKANAFCAAILNDDFIVRLESGATA